MNEFVAGVAEPVFFFWCLAVVGLLIYKWVQLGLPDSRKLVYLNCKDHNRDRVCRFTNAYLQILKEEDPQKACHIYCGFMYGHIDTCKLAGCYLKSQKESITAAV